MAETKDSEERRNEFVEAAEKLFREHGIVDTTINSIVKDYSITTLNQKTMSLMQSAKSITNYLMK